MIGASRLILVSLSTLSIPTAAVGSLPWIFNSDYTADELVAYGMSLAEYNDVRMSESEADFGGIATTDELWDEALLFEYMIATSYDEDKALSSLGYHPYVICNYAPDMAGSERAEMVVALLQNTSGVDDHHFYFQGINELNNAERACGVIRAFNDTIPKLYAAHPEAQSWIKTNPLHPSMKMVDGTVATIQARMDGDAELGMISVDNNVNGYVKRSTLEFSSVLCPGVRSFNGTQVVSGEEISNAVRNFVLEENGVWAASYYYQKVFGDGGDSGYTERMKHWADAVSFVVNLTDPTDESNLCLDKVVAETLTFEVSPFIGQGGTGTLHVYSRVSEEEGYAIAASNNMTKEDVDQCIWYALYAIALNPMVCSVEPKARPQTLCPDLTSDLSKCPASPSPSPSSGHIVGMSLMNTVVVTMTIVAYTFRMLS